MLLLLLLNEVNFFSFLFSFYCYLCGAAWFDLSQSWWHRQTEETDLWVGRWINWFYRKELILEPADWTVLCWFVPSGFYRHWDCLGCWCEGGLRFALQLALHCSVSRHETRGGSGSRPTFPKALIFCPRGWMTPNNSPHVEHLYNKQRISCSAPRTVWAESGHM